MPLPTPGGQPAPGNRDVGQIRSEALYGGDPQSAMMDILRKMGYNPFAPNEFVQMMLQAAPGLRSAWELSNIGAKAGDVAGMGGPGKMFGDFLQSEVGGGNVFGTLNNAANNMGNYAGQLRGLYNQLNDPNSPLDPNTLPAFLEILDNRLQDPGKFAQLFGSLRAPGLGSLGQSFQRTLGASSFAGDQNRINAPSFGAPNAPSFFEYIMGKR